MNPEIYSHDNNGKKKSKKILVQHNYRNFFLDKKKNPGMLRYVGMDQALRNYTSINVKEIARVFIKNVMLEISTLEN